jgi:hypothetical protein
MRLTKVTHAIAHALNMSQTAAHAIAHVIPTRWIFVPHCIQLLLAYVGNMSSENTKTLACIEDYRSFSALWDVNHKDYANRIKINDMLNILETNYKMCINP